MKIAILGSSFDPPHLGHYLITTQVKEFLKMDEIWLMPCYQNPLHKDKQLVSTKDRYSMAKLLTNTHIKVYDYEIKHKQTSYSINTLNAFAKKYPHHSFYWIIGSDLLDEFRDWKDWQKIIKNYHLIIFPRETVIAHLRDKVKQALKLKIIPKNIVILDSYELVLTNISSTMIRTKIRSKKSIKYLVPQEVEEYIIKNKLYVNPQD